MSDRIVFIGDSITDGFTYPLLFRQAIRDARRPVPQCINAGVAGDVAANIRARIDRDVRVHTPDLATLSVGINDALRDVPLDSYETDLRAILEQLRANDIRVVLFTTTILGPEQRDARQRLGNYNDILRQLSREFSITLNDVFTPMTVAAESGAILLEKDDIHPNYAGHRVIAQTVLAALGHADLTVPETLDVEILPGVVTPWQLKAVEDDNTTSTDPTALDVDDDWLTLDLPQPHQSHLGWWSNQVRQRGFAVDLGNLLGKRKRYIGAATINIDHPRHAYLNTGASLQTVWLNTAQVYQSSGWTGYHAGKERIPINLQAGANHLVIETGRDFFLSVTDTNQW